MAGVEQHEDDQCASGGDEDVGDAAANSEVERHGGAKRGEEDGVWRSRNGDGWERLNFEIEHRATVGISASRSRRADLKILW